MTVSAEAEDAGSGVESVSIWVRARCGGWIELGSFSGTSGSVAWDTTAFEPGRYELRSVAVDRRGNKAVSEPVKVYVEAAASGRGARVRAAGGGVRGRARVV